MVNFTTYVVRLVNGTIIGAMSEEDMDRALTRDIRNEAELKEKDRNKNEKA